MYLRFDLAPLNEPGGLNRPPERRALPKMNDGTQPFVQKCLEYCESDPQFVPPFLNMEGFTDDMDA